MTVESAYPLITVPPIDLWTFLFERRDREYPDEHGKFNVQPRFKFLC